MSMRLGDLKNSLLAKKFVKSLIDMGGEVYIVGGIVRDILLEMPSKDIDLVVRNINIDSLIIQLQSHGRVDVVGKSFGVIKFKASEDGQEYDIALPRQEVATGEGGHRGFQIAFDETLPIEKDLIRRDAKINAIAVQIDTGFLIDPLGGMNDIADKRISMANPDSFSDDPLRMLRVIGFASRFGFTIETNTLNEIMRTAGRIKEISGERVLIEFDKIVKKGDPFRAAYYLFYTDMMTHLVGRESGLYVGPLWEHVNTVGEFMFLLTKLTFCNHELSGWFQTKLKGDTETAKEITALEMAVGCETVEHSAYLRTIVYKMHKHSPKVLRSHILPQRVQIVVSEMVNGQYPLSLKELNVNGDDLVELGFTGGQIGAALQSLLYLVYSDELINEKYTLLEYANTTFPKENPVLSGRA